MRRLVAGISSSLVIAIVGCNDAGPPPAAPATAPATAAAPVTTVFVDSGPVTAVASTDPPPTPVAPATATPGDSGADFYSCTVDSDCIAVPRVGCCPTGHKEAVNKQSADTYKNSFVCEKTRRICPMYRILDRRQPVCGTTSHKCELMMPDQIACSGAGPDVHACPTGFRCDANGHCASNP
jgi:hypothetical protein